MVRPLVLAFDTRWMAVLISLFICNLLWVCIGIHHGALIITGIRNPFWMTHLF